MAAAGGLISLPADGALVAAEPEKTPADAGGMVCFQIAIKMRLNSNREGKVHHGGTEDSESKNPWPTSMLSVPPW